jgi:hypothetical protein
MDRLEAADPVAIRRLVELGLKAPRPFRRFRIWKSRRRAGRKTLIVRRKPSVAAEAGSRNEETTAGLAPPSGDQLIAILMDRDEIKSISDLFNNTVAIDISLRILCPR